MKKVKNVFKVIFLRKTAFSLLSIAVLLTIFQFFFFRSDYFRTLAQCLEQGSDPRADFLITSPTQGTSNRFSSRIGTCIFDKKYAGIGDFRQTSYQLLYEEFFAKSKWPVKVTYDGDINQSNLNNMASGVYLVRKTPTSGGNAYLGANPTGGPVTSVIFVEGNLYITQNFTYGSNNQGVVFVVRGSVLISSGVNQIDAVIITQGADNLNYSVCTALDVSGICPASSVNVGTNQLIINGSLIALDTTKPIRFTRKLDNNQLSAEQVNHQVKYLSILNNLLAKSTNIISEGTNYAICTSRINKPPGCPCDSLSTEQPQCIGGNQQCQSNICQPPSGPIDGEVIPPPPPPPPPAPSYNPAVNQLVAHWPFEDATGSAMVAEVVGNRNGVSYGNSTVTSGKIGLSREFNSGYVTVYDTADSVFNTSRASVSAWVYPTAAITTWPTFFDRRNANNNYSFILGASPSGGPQCWANSVSTPSSSIQLTLNSWNHIVCTYDGNLIRLYLNNSLISIMSAPGNLSTVSNPSLYIGRNVFNTNNFVGRIDDLRYYNYAISASQINSLCVGCPPASSTVGNPWIIETIHYLQNFRII